MATRVLVVDGDEATRGSIVRALERQGYEAAEASSAEQALELHRENAFPLILTEIEMDSMTGLDLLQEVQTPEAEAIVIVMTDQASLETATAALRAGAYDYLVKPFDDSDVISTVVQRAIDRFNLARDNRALMEHMRRKAEELERLGAQLTDMASRDPLTGLYNHRYLREALEKEVSRAARHGRLFSLVLIDIDHFQAYNDRLGRPAGDELLQQLARIFDMHSRRSTIVARYGGEEFALLVPETDAAGAKALAQKLRRIVEDYPFRASEGQPLGRITLSIGVATYPRCGEEAATLIDHAGRALHRSKHGGLNAVSVWTPSLA